MMMWLIEHLSSPIDDGEFEVTAEMLIHEDIDDERTLEEEEALQDEVEVLDELSNLEKVKPNFFLLGLSMACSCRRERCPSRI